MRTYLVDGTNAVRRADYDPRFPEMDERRTEAFVARIDSIASPFAGSIRVEIFFDGHRRPLPSVNPPVSVRFPVDGDADSAILGSARNVIASGRGVVVVTTDRALADDARYEGARVMGFSQFEKRLREGKP